MINIKLNILILYMSRAFNNGQAYLTCNDKTNNKKNVIIYKNLKKEYNSNIENYNGDVKYENSAIKQIKNYELFLSATKGYVLCISGCAVKPELQTETNIFTVYNNNNNVIHVSDPTI